MWATRPTDSLAPLRALLKSRGGSSVRRDMFIAKSISRPAKLRWERHEKAARFYAAPTELRFIYWPKSINRSRPMALLIRSCACRARLLAKTFGVVPRLRDEGVLV